VSIVADNNRENAERSMWKTFAVYSGASFQLAACIVVFGYLGYRLGSKTHHEWVTVCGVVVGVIVGASGLAFLAKQILGDKR
jgi:hypothetical protein